MIKCSVKWLRSCIYINCFFLASLSLVWGGMGNSECVCLPETFEGYTYNEWIAHTFSFCSYTPRQVASFYLGLANILCWIFAYFPQIWLNYRGKKAEAMSYAFIVSWLVGDAAGLIGCILARQLPWQLYTAIYYCIVDSILLIQYYLYLPNATKKSEEASPLLNKTSARVRTTCLAIVLMLFLGSSFLAAGNAHGTVVQPAAPGRTTLEIQELVVAPVICNIPIHIGRVATAIGYICAWSCGLLYFFGRIPQVTHNYAKKSVEGLSWMLFLCCFLGNTFYCGSILLNPIPWRTRAFWLGTFPYILGSGFNLLWPGIVLGQFIYYNVLQYHLKPINRTP
ncbi:lysosomal amino acid transporter 1 [Pelomyxa schiedti]|nr:lysosomal amino acid transporter 1 [Pelomyxa schiedti]